MRTADNKRWLADDPLAGVKSERQKNPKRPVTSWDRFTRTREAARALHDAADTAADRMRWLKLEYLLVIAEATGKRIGSIIQLTWEDVDFQTGVIRWRAEADKKGYDWEIPTSPDLLRDLAVYREASGRSSGLLFPSERRPNQPVQRRVIDEWLMIAEREAGLPKLTYGRWHPYRRKWATERKHLPLKDVAAAGGWKDASTLLKCYQQPDRETLLAVVTAPNKLRDAAIADRRSAPWTDLPEKT